MNKISISVRLNRNNYQSVVDKYSIYLRITINRISKFVLVPTPCKISKAEWNEKHNAINFVKSTNIYAFEINGKIRDYLNKVDELSKRYYLQNKTITFESIFKALKSKKLEMTFNLFADDYIKNPKEKFELATITKYKSFLKHLNNFNKKIYFNDITPLLVSDFKAYLEIDQNLVGSTMKSYFDKFKKIINQAEKESYLDYHQTRFLFDDARIKVNKSDRTFFEIEELLKWNELKFPPKEKYLEKNRDLFTFQIYTGFYYNDLKILKKSDIRIEKEVGIFIVGKRDKNGNTAIIPLYKFPNANRILTRYASKDENDEFLFDNNNFIEDQVYNRQLKTIAERAGIRKNVSNKVARHTNVQLWIRYGADRPVISKMVGHTKESTTKEYYDVDFRDIIEGTKKVDFVSLGI
jgi:integrase